MSFVLDQVRSLDLQLDRLQLENFNSGKANVEDTPDTPSFQVHDEGSIPSRRAIKLQALAQLLSSTGPVLVKSDIIQRCLKEAKLGKHAHKTAHVEEEEGGVHHGDEGYSYENELEWIVVSKAAIQAYGLILDALINQILPLSQDLFYWDEILSSYRYTGLYSLQTSPLRLWNFSWDIYEDAKRRFQELRLSELSLQGSQDGDTVSDTETRSTNLKDGMTDTLMKLYELVKSSIRSRSLLDLNKRTVSPFALIRQDIKKKQVYIKRLKEMQASGLGVLVNEGLSFESEEEREDWKGVVERSVVLLENVVRNVMGVDQTIDQFEDTVFSAAQTDIERDTLEPKTPLTGRRNSTYGLTVETRLHKKTNMNTPYLISAKLQDILSRHLPAQVKNARQLTETHGRPGKLVRYWLPAAALLLSSGTLLRIVVKRKAAITIWIRDIGTTLIDFWDNWVIDPVRQIIGTIRHSGDSDIALMSRKSLTADMDSLERMVVDFAVDNPSTSTPDPNVTSLDAATVDSLRLKIKEGDLTPVLRVYEKDMKSPIYSAIRGELVRALLIQIQKTKVDVEVAIAGIDKLLKSQQLLFGFLGLTPGILVCVGAWRWVRGSLGGKKSVEKSERKSNMLRTLRNIDRILTSSQASLSASITNGGTPHIGTLTFKEHGLLLCEIHVLRDMAKGVMPRSIMMEFVEDLNDLSNIRNGVGAQMKVVERLRWAYAQWLR